jgi:hypothetical protein
LRIWELGLQEHDCRAGAATPGGRIEEIVSHRARGQETSDFGSPNSPSLPVNYPNFPPAALLRFLQIIRKNIREIPWQERVKIERIFDWNPLHSQFTIHNSQFF